MGGGVRLPCLCASRARGTRRHTTPTLDRVVTRLESESYQLTRRAPGNLVSGRNVTLSGDAPPEYRSGWGSSELHQGSLARSIGSGPTVPQTCPNRVPSGGQPCPFGGPTVSLRGANRVPSGGQPYPFGGPTIPLCARKSFVRCENWCSRPRPRQRRGWGDAGAVRLAATAPRLPNKLNHHESVANRTCLGSGCVASSDPRRFVRSSSCFVTRGALRIIINTYWNHRF